MISFRSPYRHKLRGYDTPHEFRAGLRDVELAGKVIGETFTRKNRPDILCREIFDLLKRGVGYLRAAVCEAFERVLRGELDHLILGQR